MKYFKSIFYLLTISLALTSCDRDLIETDIDSIPNTLFFLDDGGILQVEEGELNQFDIDINATALPSTNVPYSITIDEDNSTAIEGVDFDIVTNNLVLPSGQIATQYSIVGDFKNASTNGKMVVFNLSSAEAKIGNTNQFTLQLFKSCPFEGLNTTSYDVDVFAFDDQAPSHSVTLVPVAGTDNQWTVTSSWGPDFVAWATGDPSYSGAFLYSGTIVLNDDYTVDFIGNDAWATGGSGNYSPCTQVFDITLTQGLFTTSFTTQVVMSPN